MSKIDATTTTSRRELLMAGQHQDFGDQLYAQMKNAPWVLCSLGVHGVILGFLLLLPSERATVAPAQVIQMAHADEPLELRKEEEPEVKDEVPFEELAKSLEDPVIKDAKVSDHNETDEDLPDASQLGDPRSPSDAPFAGPGTNGEIGIGGGGGGPFGGRTGGRQNLKARGRGVKTQVAVDLALEWLKNHQSPDGSWDSDGFDSMCKLNTCDGKGDAVYDPGLTGLALLCFLGAGETQNAGQYKDTVKNGLRYLKQIQDSEGCFGPRTSPHFQYNHMCAALAMTEAFGMTGSRLLKDSAQKGVDFVHASQNPYVAWRYGVRDGDNDTSVTGWAVMVLKSAKIAGLNVDSGAFRGAKDWIDKMTEPEFGRVGYQRRGGQPARTTEMMERFPAEQSESLTGVGVLVRIFSGEDPEKSEFIQKGADLMAKKPPVWDVDRGTIDFYYWYYATLAMFQVGGRHWETWNDAMKPSIVDNQRAAKGEDERGSWDPIDPWGAEGGRIYSTALNCLCLEVYYRYGRVVGSR